MSRAGYALALSGGGVRATVFHLGVLLRLATEERLERVTQLSTVSGGSLAAALVFGANRHWPSSRQFIQKVLPHARMLLTERSLQGSAALRTLARPWWLVRSRGNLFAEALEKIWGVQGSLKQLAPTPLWLINSTCFETGRDWRFSQRHIGDWRFGHNYIQEVPISIAIAASAAIPYMAGFVTLTINPIGWHAIDPATDAPKAAIDPPSKSVRLWDGGVYENLGLEALFKPQRGLVDNSVNLLIASDASAILAEEYGPASGVFMARFPFLRPPRLFDIASEQVRALRSRMLVDAAIRKELSAALLRLGRPAIYIDRAVERHRPEGAYAAYLSPADAKRAASYPTDALKMRRDMFDLLLRHGFETADLTLTGYHPDQFQVQVAWQDAMRMAS